MVAVDREDLWSEYVAFKFSAGPYNRISLFTVDWPTRVCTFESPAQELEGAHVVDPLPVC